MTEKKRTIILMGLVIVLLLALFRIGNYYETHYNREVVVVDVNGVEITVEDTYNHQWVFLGEGYEEGQEIEVKMFTNNTYNVNDDEILNVIE